MAFKCPFAFEWPQNKTWNAEERLKQRINLESQKDPDIWSTAPCLATLAVRKELKKLEDTRAWKKEPAEEAFTHMVI